MSSPTMGQLREQVAAPGLELQLVADEAGWQALAAEWDGLLARMARPSPFLTFTWLDTWRRHFGQHSQLFTLVARAPGGELVGLAPMHIVRRRAAGLARLRSLEFLGYRGSAVCGDHADFIAAESDRGAVCRVLVAELQRRSRDWDAAVLADLSEYSPVPEAWRELAPALPAEERPAETCYYVPLPADITEFWAGIKRLHSEFARSVRRNRERLQRQKQVVFVAPVPAAEVPATLEALARLHGLARGLKGEAGNFGRPAYRAFHEDLLRRLAGDKALYLARLDVDHAPVAVFYGFVAGEVLYFYQQGYDPALGAFGVGKSLLAEVYEDAIGRMGVCELDFLRGGEGYKTHWTSSARQTRTLWSWRPTVAGRLSRQEWLARRRAAGWLRSWRQRRRPAA